MDLFDSSYSFQDEVENMGIFQQFDEKKLPKFQQLDLNKDYIQLDTIKFSLTRLKQKKTQQEIKKIYESLSYYVRNSNCSLLEYVPFQLLIDVDEFAGKQYFPYQNIQNKNYQSKNIPKTVQFISHIKFSNLQILKINNLKITSVQNLTWIQALNLRCLQLYENRISNLNILTKADFPRLQIITFYKNPITEIEKFCRIHSKKLTGYEFDNKETYNHRVEDYRFLFKMQNPQLKMLKVQDQKRIDLRDRPAFKILNQPGVKILHYEPQVIYRGYLFADDDDDVTD